MRYRIGIKFFFRDTQTGKQLEVGGLEYRDFENKELALTVISKIKNIVQLLLEIPHGIA